MLTRVPHWRVVALITIFVLTCLTLAITVWRTFGGPVPFEAQGYRVEVRVPEADAVFANSPVRMAGIDIGDVAEVESLGRSARVVLEIDPAYAPLKSGARVTVRTKTLLGEGYVEVAPGAPSAPDVADGGSLDAGKVERAQRLDDVLQTFPEATRADIRALVSGMSRGLDGRAADMNDSLGRAEPFADQLGAVTRLLDGQRVPLQQLMASASDVFGAMAGRSAAVGEAIGEGQRVLASTSRQARGLTASIDALPAFLTDLRRASQGLEAMGPDLKRATASLEPTAKVLTPALNALATDTTELQRLFRDVTPVFRRTTTTLPELDAILEAAGPALTPVHLASRQLLPFMQLSAVSRKAIVANFASIAAAFNGRWVMPGNRLAGYVSATLSAWNEIVGGWTKKLPSNRSNPYPRPGQSDNMAKGGLEAYDCRNTGNPAILPAIGAVPECKTQGAWEFNGKKAYYPRLTLPAP